MEEFLVVIIYDIADNKKRYRLSRLLEGYGERVQKSAFEARLSNSKYNKLISEIDKLINDTDYVRAYKITANSTLKVWGNIPTYEEEEFFFL